MHTVSLDVDSVLRDGVPEWERIGFDVCCARCGYNLRGLAQPRCPECGLEFEWGAALRQSELESDFLFEHQWRRRPVRSFFVTVWRSFRPVRFWRSVSIHNRVDEWPLFFVLAASILLAFICAEVTARVVSFAQQGSWENRAFRVSAGWSHVANVIATICGRNHGGPRPPAFATWFAAEMAATLLAMLVFILSMRGTLARCRVRSPHVLRVIAYSAAPVVVLELIHATTIVALLGIAKKYCPDTTGALVMDALLALFAIGAIAIPATYVGIGLRVYLSLPHAWFIALLAATIGLLSRGLIAYN